MRFLVIYGGSFGGGGQAAGIAVGRHNAAMTLAQNAAVPGLRRRP